MLEYSAERRLGGRELRALLRRRRAEVDTLARLHEVDRQKAYDERQGSDRLEVDDRSQRESADALHIVPMARDPDDESREKQRNDQRLDHPQEHGGQHVEIGRRPAMVRLARGLGESRAEEDPDDHRDENPLRESDTPEE